MYVLIKGGEESTIEYMESQSVVDPKVPLLNEAYAYGVVEHPFPLNCLIRKWHLGSDFYNAVKIGIVQYVCAKYPAGISLYSFVSSWFSLYLFDVFGNVFSR